MKTIKLGNELFPTKASITGYISKHLQGADIGDNIQEKDELFWVLKDLVHLHSKSEKKIGAGIKRFFVGETPNSKWRGRCFWIKRWDDSIEDISTKKCIDAI